MMAQLFVKTVLTIAFILLHDAPSSRWFLLLLLVISMFGLAFLYTTHLPYYQFRNAKSYGLCYSMRVRF